ncbi:MAG: BatA and WFA domain-containing protein [Phycisphaerales bacterium]|nr:MAG: BatA and WFA domain-containing protein [Phycisphaerales bacterium]
MSWLTPWAGAILAAAVIPPLILLYFLKLRRRPQPIACTLLWKRSVEDLHANAPFQRLRRSLLLFLQLLVLVLLALSIMQPMIQSRRHAGGKTVIIIDNSASMTATDTDDGVTRLDHAKRLARERIESMYSGGLFSRSPGETMIIAFSNRAEPMTQFTDSKAQLLAAVDGIRPTHAETEIAEALKLARAYTLNVVDELGEARPVGDPPTIVLYSDGRIADLAQQVLRGEEKDRFLFHLLGSEEPDNTGIATISVQRPYDRPDAAEVFAELVNFNPEPVSCDIQLSINEIAPDIMEIRLPAAALDEESGNLLPGRRSVLFPLENQSAGAVFGVTNLRADDLAADNVAYAVAPPPKKLKVLLVAPDRILTEKVLEGMTLDRLEVRSPQQYEALAGSGSLDAYDVVILEGYAPPSAALIPPGRYLTLGPTPPLEGLNEYGEGEAGMVFPPSEDHPIFRDVNLENLFIAKQTLLAPADDVQVLAEGTSGPLMLAVSRGRLQLIHVAFDPLDSNWWLLRSWVNFIFNAVEYLGQMGTGLSGEAFSPGAALTARLPTAATDIRLKAPDEPEVLLTPPDSTRLSWGPIRLTGLHLLSWSAPDEEERSSRLFAVNLLSSEESDIARAKEIVLGSESVEGRTEAETRYTPLWPWAIGLGLVVLMLEWWIYHKKAYI